MQTIGFFNIHLRQCINSVSCIAGVLAQYSLERAGQRVYPSCYKRRSNHLVETGGLYTTSGASMQKRNCRFFQFYFHAFLIPVMVFRLNLSPELRRNGRGDEPLVVTDFGVDDIAVNWKLCRELVRNHGEQTFSVIFPSTRRPHLGYHNR